MFTGRFPFASILREKLYHRLPPTYEDFLAFALGHVFPPHWMVFHDAQDGITSSGSLE